MAFDFTTYLQSQAIGSTAFEVRHLTGGFTNITARVTFPTSIPLFSSSKEYASAILKYAPPHLASDASHTVSVTRQVIEARALELITGQEITSNAHDPTSANATFRTTALKDALDDYPLIQVPSVIHHDTQNNVLWIEDLGELQSVADALDSPRPVLPAELELAHQLGSFLAQFHHASKSIPAETVQRLIPMSTVVNGGIHEYLVKLTRDALSDLPGVDEEKEVIASRVEESLRDDTDRTGGGCLGMVDFWPGSVIVSDDWKVCGLIDWEYFGRSNEGSELGMFLAHFHIATLKPCISPKSAERLGNFISAMCEAYSQAAPSVVACPRFKKRLLMSYGREMITGVSMYRYLDEESSRRVRMAGVRGIKAVECEDSEPRIEELGREEGEGWLRRALRDLGFNCLES